MAAFSGGVARPTELEEVAHVHCFKRELQTEREERWEEDNEERERVEAGPDQRGRWGAVQVAGSIGSEGARRREQMGGAQAGGWMGKIDRNDGLDRAGGEEVGRARKWRRWFDWVEMDPEVGEAGGGDWTGRIPRK